MASKFEDGMIRIRTELLQGTNNPIGISRPVSSLTHKRSAAGIASWAATLHSDHEGNGGSEMCLNLLGRALYIHQLLLHMSFSPEIRSFLVRRMVHSTPI